MTLPAVDVAVMDEAFDNWPLSGLIHGAVSTVAGLAQNRPAHAAIRYRINGTPLRVCSASKLISARISLTFKPSGVTSRIARSV